MMLVLSVVLQPWHFTFVFAGIGAINGKFVLLVNHKLPISQAFFVMNPFESPSNGLLPTFHLPETAPDVHPSALILPGAIVLGAAQLGAESSVWFGSVIRADINRIVIGDQSNVQDGSVLHVSDDFACLIGHRVTIGHRAVVHACTVHDEVLIGMGAIILDGAEIGPRSIIAAGALVTKGTKVPEGSLVIGSPAKIVRALTVEEQKANARLAMKYVEVSRRYRELGYGVKP